jgi:hypothetical protein
MSTCTLSFLVLTNVITSSMLNIIMPILVTHYESIYFILMMSGLQFCVIFFLIYGTMIGFRFYRPKNIGTLVWIGIYNTGMAICMIYGANPSRTPIVIQVIVSSLVILPSVLFTKYILNKRVVYDKNYIVPSIVSLALSVIISLIPFFTNFTLMGFFWIMLFLTGVIFRSAFSIMQEKYIMDTKEYTLLNKITIVFYSRIFQFLTMITFFWLEFLIGYSDKPADALVNSIDSFVNDGTAFFLLEFFVGSYLLNYIFAVYLNSISTNYNMISTIAVNPLTVTFFTIFPRFNPGIKYELYITIPGLFFSVLSVWLWLKGERKDTEAHDEYTPINSEITDPNHDVLSPIASTDLSYNALSSDNLLVDP